MYLLLDIFMASLFSFIFISYTLFDKYIYYVINKQDYISCEMDIEEDIFNDEPDCIKNKYLITYSCKECFNAYDNSFVKTLKKIKHIYVICKYIIRPFEILLVKSNKIYFPYLLYICDTIIKYLLYYIYNSAIIQYIIKKIMGYILRKLIPIVILYIHRAKPLSKNDNKQLIKTLNDINNNDNDTNASEKTLVRSLNKLCDLVKLDEKIINKEL